MSQSFGSYLHEMGIQPWELIHPERMLGVQSAKLELPQKCCLLLVTDKALRDADLSFFERILATFDVTLDQVCRVTPDNFVLVELSTIEWVWFAGCSAQQHNLSKQLISPYVEEINGNTQHRRELWQQICAYRGQQ
ncbi:DNA polymerase III subunit psi [Vibrio palustris]|uniref:DNA polymerase III subunit psi n=1 Tax=Vibrio palustris TaxID=1918946 RepID=A0A1R4B8T4_9VIBR|nr:DNA polymerase III subunit psi [Vibrio palustris]SJL85312.1 DNA polymerase III subunit psi [Vibrio palustris]